ncbi:MAG: hypothetical protein COW71_07735 [Ignavibacteriales bacterium CG18_big_fil_WC_8_21_14_2_50_31_20]|nr:MAG: hypothetical protein COW71_07735 [Ignavibacteriales bacterium CG18_big_fil_WC_8_21_14_2_50_31_20]PIS46201.1 MAG: hypothetical protein COT22_01245 [Ignavibacteria bacterium CG08_land_8_20_14_0_20_37_9]PJC59749.1 MAG: hypothetical protein CO025_05260 [Ignavibacteria bacterium CG_4_9_14_0_2_um_filter_37_13]
MGINKKVVDNFYATYPFFFYSHYDDISEEKIYSLAKCGNIFMTYILVLDNTFDQDNPRDNSTLILLHYLHQTAISELSKLFPEDSLFWTFYIKYEYDFFSTEFSSKLRETHSNEIDMPKFEDFIEDILKRNSFAKCATAGLLSLKPKLNATVDPFIATQDLFHIGLQLLDDLEDWKKDFKNNISSYVLAKSLSDPTLINALKQNPNKTDIIGKYIYYSGLAVDILEMAISYFKKSLNSVSEYNVPYWKSFLENFILKTEKQRDEISFKVNRNLKIKKTHSSLVKNTPFNSRLNDKLDNKIIKSAIEYINIEFDKGFVEMEHIMELPDFSKGINPNHGITVVGKLFQSTIVLDLFFDLNDIQNNLISEEIIDNEIKSIMDSKMQNVRGGWNYFPNYKYLPPDTDDLAQVLQVLVKSKRCNINEYFDDSIGLLLDHNTYPNNVFKTWILDPDDDNLIQDIYKTTLKNYWGDFRGADIEVTANMLYALALYDYDKYSTIISKGIDSIISLQNAEGTWSSIWYWYNFYGTYVVVRLLSYLNTKTDALKLTAKYLKDNQNKDGGWGVNTSDPLSTALSVLILIDIKKTGYEIDIDVFKQSINYLNRHQKETGAWAKVPFIKMKVGNKYVTYRSSTISTVFVLKAICGLIKHNISLI